MTKEELKQEAEEYLKKHNYTSGYIGYFASDYCERAYIDSAEPREKHITELEKENAELKYARDNCEQQFQDKVDELGIEISKNIEAKDLIRNLLRVTWGEGWNYSLEWKVKAEEFLKECEE